MDIAKRNPANPLLRPSDLKPCIPGMEITCLLNPGVFRMNGKTWLLLRVAERPVQQEGVISFPVYNDKGEIEVLSFDKNDPEATGTMKNQTLAYNSSTKLTASRLSLTPPFLKEAKNPGPTWRPMEKTKRIRPKSFMNWSTVGLHLRPKWLTMMPTNSIQVEPMDMPLILNRPSRSPRPITKAKSSIEWAMPVPVKSDPIISRI